VVSTVAYFPHGWFSKSISEGVEHDFPGTMEHRTIRILGLTEVLASCGAFNGVFLPRRLLELQNPRLEERAGRRAFKRRRHSLLRSQSSD
jgi:hypothetical protein